MESPLPCNQKYNILRSILKMEYEKELLNLSYDEQLEDQTYTGIIPFSFPLSLKLEKLKLKMDKIQKDINQQKNFLQFGHF